MGRMKELVIMIEAYESGQMDELEMVDFFQYLVNTGVINQLQGSYQRTAVELLKAGAIVNPQKFVERQRSS